MMYEEASVVPLCFAPFSIADMVYNPTCYTAPLVEILKEVLRIYIKFNLMFIQVGVLLVEKYWFPVVYGMAITLTCVWLIKQLLAQEEEIALTALESEIVQYIHMNASTGSTARMVCEHLTDFYDGYPVRMEEVTSALQQLKKKGVLLSTQATLWVVSGN
jgi:hypothetical protein